MILGDFQLLTLRLVHQLGSDAYGMKIRDHLSKELGKEVHMPQVYAALSRLVKLGLASSERDEKNSVGQRGGIRRVYQLSANGLRMLSDGIPHLRRAEERSLYHEGEAQSAEQTA